MTPLKRCHACVRRCAPRNRRRPHSCQHRGDTTGAVSSKGSICGKTQADDGVALVGWVVEARLRPRPPHEPPRRTRPRPSVGPAGSVTGPAGYSPNQSAHHSRTLPCIWYSPQGFGAKLRTGSVRSRWLKWPPLAPMSATRRHGLELTPTQGAVPANSDRSGRSNEQRLLSQREPPVSVGMVIGNPRSHCSPAPDAASLARAPTRPRGASPGWVLHHPVGARTPAPTQRACAHRWPQGYPPRS